jgi:hypothetical protein
MTCGFTFGRLALVFCCLLSLDTALGDTSRGNQFIGMDSLSGWAKSAGTSSRERVFTSPEIVSRIRWNELILSWNVDAPKSTFAKFEVRVILPNGPSKWYSMGLWSPERGRRPRESVLDQEDANGNVSTDTLILKRASDRFQVRATLGRDDVEKARLKFIGAALTDSTTGFPPLLPNKTAWGRLLPVPERTQMIYTNGHVICSPTTVSMLMGYWATKLNRPEIDPDVPNVVDAVYDTNWKGAGNWAFNMAYAGGYNGIRAYVTRMSDISQLEEWIKTGTPVGLSVCYDLLRGRVSKANGHLVVLVGFDGNGDPVINDPGTTRDVRKTFKRQNLARAWAYSKNAAYLIYPEGWEVPKDTFGEWDSWTSQTRLKKDKPLYK